MNRNTSIRNLNDRRLPKISNAADPEFGTYSVTNAIFQQCFQQDTVLSQTNCRTADGQFNSVLSPLLPKTTNTHPVSSCGRDSRVGCSTCTYVLYSYVTRGFCGTLKHKKRATLKTAEFWPKKHETQDTRNLADDYKLNTTPSRDAKLTFHTNGSHCRVLPVGALSNRMHKLSVTSYLQPADCLAMASSIITGMRGAQGGRQPAEAKPLR